MAKLWGLSTLPPEPKISINDTRPGLRFSREPRFSNHLRDKNKTTAFVYQKDVEPGFEMPHRKKKGTNIVRYGYKGALRETGGKINVDFPGPGHY